MGRGALEHSSGMTTDMAPHAAKITNMNPLPRALLVTVLTVLLCLGSGCSRETRHPPVPAGSSVLAIGNSVTYGTGAEAGKDYPTQLAAISGWTIHNHGIPGDTSEGVKNRIAEAVTETKPALVLLEIGGNDFLRRKSTVEVKENIRAILKHIRTQGIPVVLISVPQFSPLGAALGSLSDASLYAELAEEEKVMLIPNVFADVLSDRSLKADTIHPNSMGYRVMAEGIAKNLAKTGLLRQG
jgi:acyl-CoA thioesterase-1